MIRWVGAGQATGAQDLSFFAVFSPFTVHQPWAYSDPGRGTFRAMSMVDQYTAWVVRMSVGGKRRKKTCDTLREAEETLKAFQAEGKDFQAKDRLDGMQQEAVDLPRVPRGMMNRVHSAQDLPFVEWVAMHEVVPEVVE